LTNPAAAALLADGVDDGDDVAELVSVLVLEATLEVEVSEVEELSMPVLRDGTGIPVALGAEVIPGGMTGGIAGGAVGTSPTDRDGSGAPPPGAPPPSIDVYFWHTLWRPEMPRATLGPAQGWH